MSSLQASPATLIVNARMVNEGREFDGDLRIVDGRIAQIGTGLAARGSETVVDARGRRLLPSAHSQDWIIVTHEPRLPHGSAARLLSARMPSEPA